MCTIHTLYTYTTIEVVDIDDDLDFTMYGYGKKVTLIIHTPIEFNISTRKWTYEVWEGGPCIGGAKGFSTCYSTYDLFQILSSHEQYYCHILNSCSIWLSVCMIYKQHLYIFSPLYQITHTFVLRHSDIDHLVNTGIFSWQWIYLMGLNCIRHYEKRWI